MMARALTAGSTKPSSAGHTLARRLTLGDEPAVASTMNAPPASIVGGVARPYVQDLLSNITLLREGT
jgi:hypothetical protein